MKIAKKILIVFVVVALLGTIAGTVGILNIRSVVNADAVAYKENISDLSYVDNAIDLFQKTELNAVKLFTTEDAAQQKKYIADIDKLILRVDDFLQSHEANMKNDVDNQLIEKLNTQWIEYKLNLNKAVNYLKVGQRQEAADLINGKVAVVGEAVQQSFADIFVSAKENAETRIQGNMRVADTSSRQIGIIMCLTIVISIILGNISARSVSRPIEKITTITNELALGNINIELDVEANPEIGDLGHSFALILQILKTLSSEITELSQSIINGDIKARADVDKFHGDYKAILTNINEALSTITRPIHEAVAVLSEVTKDGNIQKRIEGEYQGDHNTLKIAINTALDAFNNVLEAIKAAGEQVALGARQLSDSSVTLSQGATEQASSIEQLTASLEEITVQTQQNAEAANNVNKIALALKTSATEGNLQMEHMLQAMKNIEEGARNIARVIKVIDEVAFQTNILAINAAVEAARAGQHGKGFSVVAEEVRNLATRCAEGAKETENLIQNSLRKVESGSQIAEQTAETFAEIMDETDKVADLIREITAASNEQAAGIKQINQGIMQISTIVQTNSAMSEENAAASEELSGQANFLMEQVGRFKLTKEDKPTAIELKDTRSRNDDIPIIKLADDEFGKY